MAITAFLAVVAIAANQAAKQKVKSAQRSAARAQAKADFEYVQTVQSLTRGKSKQASSGVPVDSPAARSSPAVNFAPITLAVAGVVAVVLLRR